MCTVTYIPTPGGFYFTSNRDEKASRATIPPRSYTMNGIELIYPRDEFAGGTWFASSLDGRTACLLNGAFENHIEQNSYEKSRGLILLESFALRDAVHFAREVELKNIEPFTLLILDHSAGALKSFIEFRWDGENKHIKKIDHSRPLIWSSSTLYSPEVQDARQRLFEAWIRQHQDHEDRKIVDFHNKRHGLKPSEDIIMKGKGDLMTLSISQIIVDHGNSWFNYFDIINNDARKIDIIKRESINA